MGEVAPADRLITLPEGVPALTLGWETAEFASKYLKHPNGTRAGMQWKWTESQIRFLLWWYAIDENGTWLFHHAVRRLAKGSGKSPVAALIALLEFCGPVRVKDIDPRLPFGVIGKPVDMPLVQIAATAESQTSNTMRMVRAFAPKGSRLAVEFSLDPGKTKYYKPPEGTLEIITSSAAAAEGAEATFVVEDETEWWLPGNGGPELAATIDDNLAKSGNRSLETSNAPKPGIGAVAEDSYDAWVAQEEGRTRGEGLILYDARIAPPETDLADEALLRKGLEFVYGDCWWQSLDPIIKRIWDPRSKPDDSKRKYLNWPVASADSWCTRQDWAALADATQVICDGDEIVAFFDGSRTSDATALIGCHVETGYVFTIGVWEAPPPPHEPGYVWAVPVHEVDAAVEQMFDRWDVRAFFGDVREWESFTKTTWPERYGDGLEIWAVPGGRDPQVIAWDMRNQVHVHDFTMAAEFTLTEITEDDERGEKVFHHDGDSRTGRHVVNSRRHPNRFGVSIAKESRDSPKKIDASVCVIGARMVRRLLLAERAKQPQKKPRSGKVHGFA